MRVDTAEFVISAYHREQFLRDGRPEVAFVGRSNVGKSSLMNRLLRRKGLAKTGSTPGRTRAVNYFLINRKFYFVDLPGYGFAKAPRGERQRWATLMNEYFRRPALAGDGPSTARMQLIQLVDGKVGATVLDAEGRDYFCSLGLAPITVATKIDKVSRSRRARSLQGIRQRLELPDYETVLPVSAMTGEGVQELWKGISGFLTADDEEPQTVDMK